MARIPRCALPDGVYHITSRGVEKRLIYRDDDDRRFFLRVLASVFRRFGWRCHALCLMGNHYHLVLDTTVARLSGGMHVLNGRYAAEFNRKYDRYGHLFGDRFGTRLIRDETHLASACAYVVLNPVRAGLCATAAEWPWSWSRYGLDV
jgi:REP element-mobilizing transposase RayT